MPTVRVVDLRKEEEWARRIVAAHLSRHVCANDDGTEPGMYDLRVGRTNAPDIAIEVSAAVDELRTQTWNTGPAEARGPSRFLATEWSRSPRTSRACVG